MQTGFLLIDKPSGMSSFQVCRQVKKVFDTHHVGHSGTLDPLATGLLLVAVGHATRLLPFVDMCRKTYQVVIQLGVHSESLDLDTPVLDVSTGHIPSIEEIQQLMTTQFLGVVEQVPPNYSAIRLNGTHAYDLARGGKPVTLAPRKTEIFSHHIIDYKYPFLKMELEVAAGFYVRSLARDIGRLLSGGGLCYQLRRTHIEHLSVENAVGSADMKQTDLLPVTRILAFPQLEVTVEQATRLLQGQRVRFIEQQISDQEHVWLTVKTQPVGVASTIDGVIHPRLMFRKETI